MVFLLLQKNVGGGLCLLTGVAVYHGLFQLEALPMIFLRQPLSGLAQMWLATVAVILVSWLLLEIRNRKRGQKILVRMSGSLWVKLVMVAAVAIQFYYIITNDYLGWDTSAYVGTIATSVARNSMYLFDGLTGKPEKYLDFRYALSSFYMHSAVWCRVLPVRAIYYAKIVQGGMLCLLSNMVLYQMGKFLFEGRQYHGIVKENRTGDCAAAVVIAGVILNFFFKSIYTTSEFLLNRALEAKGYCGNYVLVFIFLLGIMMWRDSGKKEMRVMLFAAAAGSVAVSMSALLTVPVLITILMVPVLLREKSFEMFRFYVACMLPNVTYAVVYLLYIKGIIRIRVE